MSGFRTYKIFAVVTALALLISACGTAASQEGAISTAVAQTVQAGESLTKVASLPTPTPIPPTPAGATTTPATPTSPPTLISGSSDPNCVKASLVAENPPDKTIFTPGEYFWKTWTLQNNGTCTWTTLYHLVFWDGDRLGSSLSYPLPDDVFPGESINLSVYLQAPEAGGTFTGFWRLKTPWESNFGVGQYDSPISTSIVVNSSLTPASRKTETVFGVTSVTYEVNRECGAANTFYTITAYINSNGPVDIQFYWIQSDGNSDLTNKLTFTEAATKVVKREWSQHKESNITQRWAQIVINSPTYQEFDKVLLPELCDFKE